MPRNKTEYLDGLNKFLDFAFEYRSVNGTRMCPYLRCHHNKWPLICKQFPKNYKVWIWHGETYDTMQSNVVNMPSQNEYQW